MYILGKTHRAIKSEKKRPNFQYLVKQLFGRASWTTNAFCIEKNQIISLLCACVNNGVCMYVCAGVGVCAYCARACVFLCV